MRANADTGEDATKARELGAEGIGLGESRELVAEFEVLQDVLHVRREAAKVVLEVGEELLLGAAGFQVAQGKAGGVVEGLSGSEAQGGGLFGDSRAVEQAPGFQDRLLGRLQHSVQPAEDAHGEDDVRVFAALEQVTEDIVGDAPDEVGDPVELGLVHE